MNIDDAKLAFDILFPGWIENKINIETEQDTRFQLIDLMLTEVLGWDREDIKMEPRVDSGYVDYFIKSAERGRLIVEAKRIDRLLLDTKNPNYASYKVSGPALRSAQEGLNQAKRYCLDTGVPFAALTTGLEWVGFWALRVDGKPPTDGKAIVFPNLQAIDKNFAKFYDLFSKEGLLKNLYQVHIYEAEGLQVRRAETLEAVTQKREIRLLQKTSLAADLESVFRQFFSTMSGEHDPNMLAQCFVESKESREADVSLEKITRNLINRVEVVESGKGGELESHIRSAMGRDHGEFVLIIGNKGAGKSTFIDRFFRLVLDRDLRSLCLIVRIDLADSDGDIARVTQWLTGRAKQELEHALFTNDTPSYEELQGVFYSEYTRWKNGEHKFLYERDKGEFKERFGDHIDKLINDTPELYVNKLLRHAAISRRQMPCLIFDNTDHYSQAFQEQVFQYAQSLYRATFSFVICPITDRTIWQLSKSGPLQSYDTTSFYLPVPSTKEVLSKRVSYLRNMLATESKKDKSDSVLTKGMRLSINDIGAFAASIDDIFVKTDFVSRTVGWLSNHDIRRSLKISQRIITSPLVTTDELLKTYLTQDFKGISRARVAQALLFGDYNQFNQDSNEFILNVFTVESEHITSPLLMLSILRVLMDREFGEADSEMAYMSIDDVQNYFEPCGVDRASVKRNLGRLLEYRLVEPYDPTEQIVHEELLIRITHCGQIHYEFAMKDFIYIQSMALTTPMRGHYTVDKIRGILQDGGKMGREDWDQIQMAFIEYVLEEDSAIVSLPSREMYESQRAMRSDLRSKWTHLQI